MLQNIFLISSVLLSFFLHSEYNDFYNDLYNIKYYKDRREVLFGNNNKTIHKESVIKIPGLYIYSNTFWTENDNGVKLGYCMMGGAKAKYYIQYKIKFFNILYYLNIWLDDDLCITDNEWGVCGILVQYHSNFEATMRFIDKKFRYCSLGCGVNFAHYKKLKNQTTTTFFDKNNNPITLNNNGFFVDKIISTDDKIIFVAKGNILHFRLNDIKLWRERMIYCLWGYFRI